MIINIRSCAVGFDLPDFNYVSHKLASLITITIQIIIKQKCKSLIENQIARIQHNTYKKLANILGAAPFLSQRVQGS